MKNNNYRIIRELGSGGMSTVYLAEHVQLHSLWAIKQIFKDKWGAVAALTEPDILKKLSHPMLPHIIDVFEEGSCLYIAEEYIEGENLRDYIERNGPVEEAQAIQWMRDLCDVLSYLHNQEPYPIIYRDLKPSNIMLCGNQTIRLIDFGTARTYKSEATEDTTLAGTRGYAAPEQFNRDLQTDARADLYALGVTMYQILTGKRPKIKSGESAPIRSVRPEISPGLARIISKCTQVDPEKRYCDAEEILLDLDRIRDTGSADEQVPEPKQQSKVTKKILPVLLLCAVLLAGVAVFIGRNIFTGSESGGLEASETGEDAGTMEQAADAGTGQVPEAVYEVEDISGTAAAEVATGDTISASEESSEQEDPYRDLAAEIYPIFQSGEYKKLLEVDDGGLWNELITSLETGERYYLYAPENEENVLAVYQYGITYFGNWKDGKREGHGVWMVMLEDEELCFEGTWKNDMPNGEGVVREYYFSRPEGWGELYPVFIERKGTFTDGYYDGEFQIKWEISDDSVRDFTPVTFSMGVSNTLTRDEIYQWLIEHNYPPFQAEEMADEELMEMEETQSKAIAMCMDTVGRVFTLHENLIDGKDDVNDVFWIHDVR